MWGLLATLLALKLVIAVILDMNEQQTRSCMYHVAKKREVTHLEATPKGGESCHDLQNSPMICDVIADGFPADYQMH